MNLSNSNIDDSAIAALSSLKGLRCLTVWSYGITAEGAARLQQALPNCVVLHESLEPSAAERRAAKWILKNKGYVAGGKGYYFGQIKQVDELTNGILTADFFDKIPSDGAENLAGLQSIENLLWGGMSQANIDKANLRELVSLRFLNLSGSDLNERSMQSIGRLKQIEALQLIGCPNLTDSSLKSLSGLKHLNSLHLGNSPITDNGLQHLSDLQSLSALDLFTGKLITGKGLQSLSGLTSLRELHLGYTSIDDAGLTHLEKLPRLRALSLGGTQFTPAGIAKLQAALPDCVVFHESLKNQPWGAANPAPAIAPVDAK